MSVRRLDFRSDTVTQPTPGMRAAMAQADVGDDVFGEDPSVTRLQERIAGLTGKEAALFVPSGTMSNQLGCRVHCQPGDEVILEANCHIYAYEQGGLAQLSQISTRTVPGEQGVFRVEQLEGLVRPDNPHCVRTRLLCVENTHNRGGGRIWPIDTLRSVCEWAARHGLARHLDGARLFNAAVATGIAADEWSRSFETVSICFSKGLGAPVGSALCGPRDLIAKAHRARKLFGGGMRQAGVLAAAALYALEHHIDRLAEDHAHAQRLAATIRGLDGLALLGDRVDTNLVIFRVDRRLGTAHEFSARLAERGLLANAISLDQIRMVTHLDVSADDTEAACRVLEQTVAEGAGPGSARRVASAYA